MTVQMVMPNAPALVREIGASVVEMMVESKLPPLTDGGILFTLKDDPFNGGSGPRVAFVPAPFAHDASEEFAVTVDLDSNDRLQQRIQRSLGTRAQDFRVHIIGPAAPSEAEAFRLANWLLDEVIRSTNRVAAGAWRARGGDWKTTDGMLATSVAECVFTLTLNMPVPDYALAYAPDDTAFKPTVELDLGDGSPEAAVEPPEEP